MARRPRKHHAPHERVHRRFGPPRPKRTYQVTFSHSIPCFRCGVRVTVKGEGVLPTFPEHLPPGWLCDDGGHPAVEERAGRGDRAVRLWADLGGTCALLLTSVRQGGRSEGAAQGCDAPAGWEVPADIVDSRRRERAPRGASARQERATLAPRPDIRARYRRQRHASQAGRPLCARYPRIFTCSSGRRSAH